MSIGARIRRAREAAGISQARLAEMADVTRSACSQWERDLVRPRREHLTRIAKVLGVPEAWLASGREPGSNRAGEDMPPYSGELTAEEREILRLFARLDDAARDALLVLLRQQTA